MTYKTLILEDSIQHFDRIEDILGKDFTCIHAKNSTEAKKIFIESENTKDKIDIGIFDIRLDLGCRPEFPILEKKAKLIKNPTPYAN